MSCSAQYKVVKLQEMQIANVLTLSVKRATSRIIMVKEWCVWLLTLKS